MGRIYKPVEISFNGKHKVTVGLVDTGADESVISEKLANKIQAELYRTYKATCASQFTLTGKYALITIRDLENGKQAEIEVGVSNIPFDTDEINDEGLDAILGVDFIQETSLEI
jgi:predicted aspartyl protease